MAISIAAEKIFQIGVFPVTNALLMTWLIVFLVLVFVWILGGKIALVPRGIQNIFETILEGILGLIESITQNKPQARQFFPIVMTIFLFVMLSNWIELVPGLGTVGIYEEHHGETILVPFIRSGSADLNFTLAVALVSVFSVQFMGIAAIGAAKYGKKFFVSPLHKPYFIGTFVGLLEFVGEFSRLISYSFRLFGNIFAGEVLLIVILNLVPYFVPLPFLFLELFVGFFQALIFAVLTTVFLKMGTLESEH